MILEMKQLKAGYDQLQVLRGIDLQVKPNEIVALIGPNGAGKSTVIRSIFNLTTITGGDIIFKGESVLHLPTHDLIRTGISYVNQGRIIFGNLSVRENLELGGELLADKTLIEKNLHHVYERFPILKERENELGYTLSGGQRQMLALGRALMHNPSLLLLDEPSLGLSPKLQKELFAMIKSLKEEGIAILVVEQNAKKAIEISDRTYLLEDGKIALSGGKSILKDKRIQQIYLGGR